MNNRLRNQQVTTRPRVITNQGLHTVQWIGKYSDQTCEWSYTDHHLAMNLANNIAKGRSKQ